MLLEKLLQIEQFDELYTFEYEYDNVLMWPFIKFMLLQRIYDKKYNLDNPHVSNTVSTLHKLKYIYDIFKNKIFFKYREYDIVFFNSSVGCFRKEEKYFNRLSDYFANVYEKQTLLVEHSHNLAFFQNRSSENILYHDYFKLKIRFLNIFKKKTNNYKNIDKFISFLKIHYHEYLTENDFSDCKNHLLSFEGRLKETNKVYNKFFAKVKPKLLMLEDASYGEMNSYIIRLAKEKSIHVVEYQHGLISETHPGYNFNIVNINKKYRNCLPDTFLSFGEYWTQQVKSPYRVVDIGFPHLSEESQRIKKRLRDVQTILIASSGTDYKFINKFIIDLTIKYSSYKVVFRPHPAERGSLKERYSEFFDLNIEIDISNNIYETFMRVDYFITDYSTIVYEAIAFDLPVYIFKNAMSEAYIKNSIFSLCGTVDEAIYLIENEKKQKIDKSFLWQENWKKNYKKFIASIL
jgi:hypothetical protein